MITPCPAGPLWFSGAYILPSAMSLHPSAPTVHQLSLNFAAALDTQTRQLQDSDFVSPYEMATMVCDCEVRVRPVAIDFETYYDDECSVTVLGPVAYTRHPRFEAYMVAIYDGEQEWVGDPRDFDWAAIADRSWASHNAGFEAAVCARLREQGIIPADCFQSRWIDTAALAAYLQVGRSLSDAAKVLLNIVISKQMRSDAKGKTGADLKREGQWVNMLAYCLQDTKPVIELWEQYGHLWPQWEQDVAELTVNIAMTGAAVQGDLIYHTIQRLKHAEWAALEQLPWTKRGEKPLSPKACRAACVEAGIPAPESLAEDDPRCRAWEEAYGATVPFVSAMRNYRKIGIQLKKYEVAYRRLQQEVTPSPDPAQPDVQEDVFYFSLKYAVGHTRRWSGEGGFNTQNLPRDAFEVEIDGKVESFNMRNIFVPRAYHTMVASDLAQIEARVLLWLADDQKQLQSIRDGFNVYESHARTTMAVTWPELEKLKDYNPTLYKLAKARVLGLGFGCGFKTFVQAAWTLARYKITLQESRKTVADFRRTNRPIVQLWNKFEADIQSSVGTDYEIALPSGNVIHYWGLARTKRGIVATVGQPLDRRLIYGGKLAENATQAMARDVFAHGVLAVSRLPGVKILMLVHDEVVCEIAPGSSTCKDLIAHTMTTPPEWALDLPLGEETEVMDFYRK